MELKKCLFANVKNVKYQGYKKRWPGLILSGKNQSGPPPEHKEITYKKKKKGKSSIGHGRTRLTSLICWQGRKNDALIIRIHITPVNKFL